MIVQSCNLIFHVHRYMQIETTVHGFNVHKLIVTPMTINIFRYQFPINIIFIHLEAACSCLVHIATCMDRLHMMKSALSLHHIK